MEVTVLYWMMKILPHHGVGTYSTSIISLSFPFGLNKFFFSATVRYRSPFTVPETRRAAKKRVIQYAKTDHARSTTDLEGLRRRTPDSRLQTPLGTHTPHPSSITLL